MFTEKKRSNYIIASTLPLEIGGRTKSLLERAKNLNETLDMKFTIITTNYKPKYYKIYQKYYDKGYVNENINFLNIYDFFSGRDYNYRKIIKHPVRIKGFDVCEIDKEQNYRYFKDGYFELYRSYDKKTGVLKFEDIMDVYSRIRKERLEYNDFGICHKKIIYKRNTVSKLEEIFYDDKGKVYLSIHYNSVDEKIARIYLFRKTEVKMFKSELEFIEYAFNEILNPGGVTFCDARNVDKPLLECTVQTQKYFVLHNTHMMNGKLRNAFKDLVENTEKADRIIVLTKEQLNDLIGIGVNAEKMTVLPHSVKDSEEVKKIERKSLKKFIYIGRLVKEKQVPHIIKAFGQVIKKHPEYTLDVYGDGEDADKISDLINELRLDNNVKMKGRTEDIPKVFQSGIASIIASDYEGFGLVILESLHYGCPVISYDFKYGPKDLIEDGVNGYLVEKNNIDMLADTMIKLIENPIEDATLSSDFYLSSTIRKWRELLNA